MRVLRGLVLWLALLICVCAAVLFWITSIGMSARATPGAMERYVGRSIRNLSIPKDVRKMANPMPESPENLAAGQKHFADHCASCHGNDGRGATEMGPNLYPPAPDMNLLETQNLTDGELYYIIENGVRFTGMPAWGAGGLDDRETWHLVLFVRHLPKMSQQEMLEMQHYNPKSPDEMKEEEQENQFLNQQPK